MTESSNFSLPKILLAIVLAVAGIFLLVFLFDKIINYYSDPATKSIWADTPLDLNQNRRFANEHRLEGEKLIALNCKLAEYKAPVSSDGSGVGVTTKGSVVVGSVSSSTNEQWTYLCDGNVKYTINFDLDKYRQVKNDDAF
ncbi:hypothetical protein ABH307_00655 [Acinetobacter pittii]|uniref:hypothetical protein n=1 Tax=Acinetobacter pittii TaxID=48296 RepID=UPI003261800F